jgi:hypothetical protein
MAILAAVLAPARADNPPPTRMSVWYRFDSPMTVGQSVGQNPWPAYALGATLGPGKFGTGLVLPGEVGNGLYLPNPVAFFGPTAQAGTIALWVKPDFDPAQETSQRAIIDLMPRSGNTMIDGAEVVINTDKNFLVGRPCVSTGARIPSPLKRGVWTHLALAWDCHAGWSFYVDGQKVSESASAFAPTALEAGWPGRVGCFTVGGDFPFAGTLDELRLFNYRLTDAEILQIKDLNPETPPLSLPGGSPGEMAAHNPGPAPVTLALQAWLPGKYVSPPYWGYLPFPFDGSNPATLYWVAGPTPVEAMTPSTVLPSGGTTTISAPTDPSYLGPRQLRLMSGEGLGLMQVAAEDLPGLRVELDRSSPVVLLAGQPAVLTARVTNGLGGAWTGTLLAELSDAQGHPVASSPHPVQLADQAQTTLPLDFQTSLPVGKYSLSFLAVTGAQRTLLNTVPVFATKDDSLRTICDVAVSYLGNIRTGTLAERLKADGVAVLAGYASEGGDYFSFNDYMSTILPYGFQATRTAVEGYQEANDNGAQREGMKQRVRNLGTYLRDQPEVLFQSISGEGLSAPPCYSADCTKAFQDYLQKKFDTLAALNQAWGSHYGAWTEIQQLGSAADVDQAAERLKMMKVALELPKENTARWQKLFELDRPRAIEWKRWHDQMLLEFYRDFVQAFHSTNGGRTPVGEQPCWADFKTHVLFGLGDIADAGGMDLYLPGELPATLGYAANLFLNFDMNESIFHAHNKPVLVNEMYVQDISPPLLPEAQGWWLLGRGYGLTTFFNYDYYHESTRAGLPLIFAMLDPNGNPYPAYASFCRFSRDIKTFDQRYDYHSLRREEPRVALFMSDDTSLANDLETGGATWNAVGVGGHDGAYWLTERAGFPMDFVNDAGLGHLAGKQALVVPWSHVVRQDSLQKILAFARGGGTVILDGPVGLYDEHYQPYSVLPGGEAVSAALGISFSGYEERPNRLVLDPTAGPPKRAAWYAFSSADTVGQSAGTDWPATVQGATVGEGKVGAGLVLPGQTGNGLYLPDPAAFFGATAQRGTIALWVKPDFDPSTDAGQRVLVDLMARSGNTMIDGNEVVIHTDGNQLVARASTQDTMKVPSPLRPGQWTHVALTWDCRVGSRLYVNGEQVAEHVGGFDPVPLDADWPGRVGCHTPSGGYPFAGAVDEVRLFNYPLSGGEVKSLLTDVDPAAPVVTATGNLGEDIAAQGVATNLHVTQGTVLLRDAYGNLGLVEVPVGQGKVLALLTNLGRENRARDPDHQAVGLWRSLLEDQGGLAGRYRLLPKTSTPGETVENLDHGGAGLPDTSPLFDVSVRIKDNREIFLFLVSFFGATEGTLELALPRGQFSAVDALTGEAVPLSVTAGKWQMPVSLPAFGTRVVEIKSTGGTAPFAAW